MKGKIKIVLVALIIVFEQINVFAQVTTAFTKARFSIETSPILPLGKIYAIQTAYPLWEKGEIIMGYAYQNEIIENEGQCNANTVLFGYRQFFCKGLHIDLEFFPAINKFYSYSDGNYYKGFEIVGEIRPGYRIDFIVFKSIEMYFIAQTSFLFGIYRDNPWPNMSGKPFIFPLIWIGIKI